MQMKNRIGIKRVYDRPGPEDGKRILVDRLWPRGLRKEEARIDYSGQGHFALLRAQEVVRPRSREVGRVQGALLRRAGPGSEGVERLRKELAGGPATFVYSSKEPVINNAEALKLYLENRPKKRDRV